MVIAIIVSYASSDEIVDVLTGLAGQTRPVAAVHICENGGPTSYAQLVKVVDGWRREAAVRNPDDAALPEVICHLAPGNLGYAGGINLVLRALMNMPWSHVWIINPDAVPAPTAHEALQARIAEPDVGIVGATVRLAQSGRVQSYGGVWRRWIARGLNIDGRYAVAGVVDQGRIESMIDYVSGACMLVTRAFIENVGLMDESYFLYCEEVDWCARRGRFRIGFAPDAVVHHGHGTTIGSNLDHRKRSRLAVYLDERNKLLFTRRHHGVIYPIVMFITLCVLSQYIVKGAYRNYLHGLAGWWAGVRGVTGMPAWFGRAAPDNEQATRP